MKTGQADLLVGHYRIEREIGTGGMGTVYLASRADQQFEKQVAIKIVRAELAAGVVLTRFRNERQILAGLEHPNIARMLDGGTAPDGRPYLVMEFVDGLPLNEYVAASHPSRDARLELFGKICSAVQHAHQHLVIHRDLKPGNILVTAGGEPKLLDFGIAKLIEPGSEGLNQTQTVVQLFTPAYASPEQLAGEPVTTASDIYSLGVLLYELLTGRLHVTKGADSKQLPGDLKNIVGMALRPEPERRYRSASELADDLRRYQEKLPVTARNDTLSYVARKFISRHRVACAAAAIILLAMAALILALSVQIRNTNRQRLRAERITGFMHQMLGGGTRIKRGTGGRDLKIVDVLSTAAEDLDSELRDQPIERAQLRATIGTTLSRLGLLDAADRQLRIALRNQTALLGNNSLPLAETLHDLGSNERYLGRYADAEAHLRRSAAIFHRYRDPDENEALSDLGVTLFDQGRFREAGVLLERLYQIRRAAYKPDDVTLIVMMNNIAIVRFNTGDFAGATEMQRQVVDAHRKRESPGSPSMELGYSEVNLGVDLRLSGQAAAAEPVALSAIDTLKKRLGDSHWITAYAEVELAKIYSDEGQHRLAEQEARQALSTITKTLPAGHQEYAHAWIALGSVLTAAGKPAEAEPYLRQAFALRRSIYPKGGLRVAQAADALADCLIARKEYAAAKPFAKIAYDEFKATYGDTNRLTLAAKKRLESVNVS